MRRRTQPRAVEEVAPLRLSDPRPEDEEREVEGAPGPALYRPGNTLMLGRGRLRPNESRRATIRRMPAVEAEALRRSLGAERGSSSGGEGDAGAYDTEEEEEERSGGDVPLMTAVDLRADSPEEAGLGPKGYPRLYHAGGDPHARFGFRGGAAARGRPPYAAARAHASTGLPLPTPTPRLFDGEEEGGEEEGEEEGGALASAQRRTGGAPASPLSPEAVELAEEQALQHRHHEDEICALEARARQVSAHAVHALGVGDDSVGDGTASADAAVVAPENAFRPDPASGIPQLAPGSRFFADVDCSSNATQVELFRAEYAAFLSAPPETEGGE